MRSSRSYEHVDTNDLWICLRVNCFWLRAAAATGALAKPVRDVEQDNNGNEQRQLDSGKLLVRRRQMGDDHHSVFAHARSLA